MKRMYEKLMAYEEAFVARPNESMTAAMAWGGRAQMMADR